MDENSPQYNPNNSIHGLNFTDSTNVPNNYSNVLPPTTSQNANYLNVFHGRNDDVLTVNNDNTFPASPPITSNNNVHQQPIHNMHNASTASTSQYSRYIDHTPINSLNITINSPQTNFIFMPISSSDMQNQLQQGHNHFPSTNNSQTQFQQ